jgi:dolichyl-phosphate-mannose-protein mannosyltransferase
LKRNEIILLCALFLFAFALRFYDIAYPSFRWMDEQGHVPAAINYWTKGQFEPDNWDHPPLRHILLYGFLRLFGDNPYGWRMRNVLFGALAAVLTYFFAREITKSRKIALMAGLLLATDPLHVVLSRYTYDEVYGGVFVLAAIVLYLKHNQRSLRLMLSALFMGCALAVKWYYLPCWLLVYVLAMSENRNYRRIRDALFVTSVYILLPLTVYFLSYSLWFGRGYSFGEFIEFTVNAYYAQQSYTLEGYSPNLFFMSHPSASEWFIKPVIMGQGTFIDVDRGEFILYGNNLPLWILTIPAMVGLLITAVRKKSATVALPALFFCSTYMLFLFVKRPVFIYSALPLLPFAFTAIAQGMGQLSGRFGRGVYYTSLAVMLAWSLYLYPLVTAKKVPVAPYRYIILNNPDVKIH